VHTNRLNKKIADSERMFSKWLLSKKGRLCYPTTRVHQDMSKKTTFYERK